MGKLQLRRVFQLTKAGEFDKSTFPFPRHHIYTHKCPELSWELGESLCDECSNYIEHDFPIFITFSACDSTISLNTHESFMGIGKTEFTVDRSNSKRQEFE